jgi:predicted ATPase
LRDAAVWTWDVARIRAKGYTDNVPDRMGGKLRPLPDNAQAAIQQLICPGNVVEISTMRLVFGKSESFREIRKRDPHVAPGGRPNIILFIFSR